MQRRLVRLSKFRIIGIISIFCIGSFLLSNTLSNECSAATSASLTISTGGVNQDISKPINDSSTVMPGNVAYSKEYIVNVNASDIESYTLKISGPTNLSGPTGSTAIVGAANKTPANMTNNTWGYGWGDTTATKESLAYQTLTNTNGGTGISVGNVSNNAINSSKKLVFAAKFADTNANAGHYTASVNLSLVATPAATTRTLTYNVNNGTGSIASQTCNDYGSGCSITLSNTKPTFTVASGYTTFTFQGWGADKNSGSPSWQPNGSITLTGDKTIYAVWITPGFSSITNMQQMTTSICSDAAIGTYKDLTDTRGPNGNNTYRVVKMPDGKCWMTENLRLVNKTISYSDSDIASGSFTIPASSTSGFSDNSASNAYLFGNTGYYTWCAATAGSCASATNSGASATNSICPKNWKLPLSGSGGGEFQTFTSAAGIANSSAGAAKIRGTPYNFADTGYLYEGTAYYPATNKVGNWWSRTVNDNIQAYTLYTGNSNANPLMFGYRRHGFAVRCVIGSGGFSINPDE